MMPLAPPLLSISTGWPHICESLSATMRVLMSVEAPGGNGTTKVTRPLGNACACAAPATPDALSAANSARLPSFVAPVISSLSRLLSRCLQYAGRRHDAPLVRPTPLPSPAPTGSTRGLTVHDHPLKGPSGLTPLICFFMLLNCTD